MTDIMTTDTEETSGTAGTIAVVAAVAVVIPLIGYGVVKGFNKAKSAVQYRRTLKDAEDLEERMA
jgi:hypothetical protein